jgi:hypothetical protein
MKMHTIGNAVLASSASDHYQIGYNDGCAGRVVSGPHPSAAGQAACVNQGGQGQMDNRDRE